MMMSWASSSAKRPSAQTTYSSQMFNEYAGAMLGQSLASLGPSARRWSIEAESMPWDVSSAFIFDARPKFGFSLESDLSDLTLSTESIAPTLPNLETSSYIISSGHSPMEISVRDAEHRLSTILDDHLRQARALASFKITLWETFAATTTPSLAYYDALPDAVISPLVTVRAELQKWLEASLDDLAVMLDLSPTTLVNLAKPGRTVRPKTVRKMVSMHGLLRELQRALGSNAALTWSRTVGRRLLIDGKLLDFEQYISTHIFVDDTTRKTPLTQSWGDGPELNLKSIAPIGRPSRI